MNDSSSKDQLSLMKIYSKKNIAPVMILYTNWVVTEAQKRGLKKLYFLARDGYLLYEIAKKIISHYGWDIKCRYLFCSRQALRVPSYHIIGEEAFDLLTLGGYYLTPKSVLSRAMLNSSQISEILNELDIKHADKTFIESEFDAFCKKIRANATYRKYVLEISKNAYPPTIEYFKQEGLFEDDVVAIVDSGWTGSMQRSLRQLLRNEGFNGKIIGFYFGMYVPQKDEEDGEYLTFYFNSQKGFWRKIFFNNNLFECMLSAPHPMTIGYETLNGESFPLYTKNHSDVMLNLIEKQIEGALEQVDDILKKEKKLPDKNCAVRHCYRLLKKSMVYPSTSDVELLSSFMFCDDVTEGYRNSIADKEMRQKLSSYAFFPRIWRKLTGKKNGGNELFWVYGVIAYCPKISRPWYRFNVILWEIAKIILKR